MKNSKVRLYVDMDGTLAKFYEREDCLEKMFEPGFWNSLKPYWNMLNAILFAMADSANFEVHIISKAPLETFGEAKKEKNQWLRRYTMNLIPDENIHIMGAGESKTDIAKKFCDGKLSEKDILIDDYNANLREWQAEGGLSVKFVNEINDHGTTSPKWEGLRLLMDDEPEETFRKIMAIKEDVA